jgi:HTH-type transcriptional regulator/antitoxin HigA
MKTLPKNIQESWKVIAPLLSVNNEEEYDAAVKLLNELLDEIGDNEEHPLYSLLDTLGNLIWVYDEKHYPMDKFPKI